MGIIEQKLGELLKLERERRQLSLPEISSEIKIPPENLEGIENGDPALLPTPIYFTLFSRTYAQALGIDYNRTVEAIKEEVGLDQRRSERSKSSLRVDELIPLPTSAAKRLRLDTFLKKILGVGAALVIIFLGYMLVDSVFLSNGLDRNGASEMLRGANAERLNAVAGFNWNTPEYSPPEEIRIELKVRGESWTTIMADGDTVIFKRLTPGREYTASANHRLLVSIGVPEAVDVFINERLVDLRDPLNRRISRVEVNQANLQSYLNSASQGVLKSDTGAMLHGQLQLVEPTPVTVTVDTKVSSDTAKAAPENDES